MAGKFLGSIKQSYNASTSSSYIERLSTSWFLPPTALFVFRALVSLYAFIVELTSLGYQSTHGESDDARTTFSYFTNLSYWGIAFYFAFAAAHTASYAFRGRAWLESWPGVLKWLHSMLYATVTIYPFIVTIIFWAILSDGAFESEFSAWSNLSEHAINSVFAFLEIVIPRSEPHPWLLMIPLIVLLALYLGLAYLTHATEGYYVYSFLDPATGRGLVAAYCIGILAGMLVVFVLVRYLIWVRQWLTEKKLGLHGKLSTKSKQSVLEDGNRMVDMHKTAR